MRYIPFLAIVVLAAVCLGLGVWLSAAWLWPLALLGPLVLIGVWDLCQPGHTLMRLYPVSAHFRWFCEWLRPYMRSEEHTSELQSLMRISYAVFCLKHKNTNLHEHLHKAHTK